MRVQAISIFMLGCAACATAPAPKAPRAATDRPIEVMVLGTWHFAGSDSNIVNADYASVLTPKRQAELEQVADLLAKFKPTAIIVERETAAPLYLDPKFETFSAADLKVKENEREQIGYRLAAKTGVARVYGIDEGSSEGEPDYYPYGKLVEHAAATGQKEKLDELIGGIQTRDAEEARRYATLTMREALIDMNADKARAGNLEYRFLTLDEGENQPGAELNGYWFMRNAKIFSKLIDVTKPGDRVVVVYGAGHKFWLEHLADNTPGFVRVDPTPYLRAAQD